MEGEACASVLHNRGGAMYMQHNRALTKRDVELSCSAALEIASIPLSTRPCMHWNHPRACSSQLIANVSATLLAAKYLTISVRPPRPRSQAVKLFSTFSRRTIRWSSASSVWLAAAATATTLKKSPSSELRNAQARNMHSKVVSKCCQGT